MALARALAVEPSVLLLDEPFGALDAKVRKELRDWLRRLHDDVHVTTVFVTHDQEEALEVADQIVVINEGRIEQVGSPDDLYDRPASEFVMSFLGPVTTLSGRLVRPHDIEVITEPDSAEAVPAEVTRIVRIGFEVRVEARPEGQSVSGVDVVDQPPVVVQMTQTEARAKGLAEGDRVLLTLRRGAQAVPVVSQPDEPGELVAAS
jgi:sulfate transport system ATP-binding protein